MDERFIQLVDQTSSVVDAIIDQYPCNYLWWSPLAKDNTLYVNGLSGRSISNEHPYLHGRNAMQTLQFHLFFNIF